MRCRILICFWLSYFFFSYLFVLLVSSAWKSLLFQIFFKLGTKSSEKSVAFSFLKTTQQQQNRFFFLMIGSMVPFRFGSPLSLPRLPGKLPTFPTSLHQGTSSKVHHPVGFGSGKNKQNIKTPH